MVYTMPKQLLWVWILKYFLFLELDCVQKKNARFQTMETINTICDAANKRNDKWGEEVQSLVVAERVYHHSCFKRFSSFFPVSTGRKRGCLDIEYVTTALEVISSLLLKNYDCQYSFSYLRSAIIGEVPDDETIITNLTQKFGDRTVIVRDGKIDTGVNILK